MVATETRSRRNRQPPVAREGTLDADLDVITVLRDYVLAATDAHEAKQRRDAARDALAEAAGTHQAVRYAGEEACHFEPTGRRTADLDRLAERWPDAYADVIRETPGYRLVVDGDYRRVLRLRTWRTALRRRAAA